MGFGDSEGQTFILNLISLNSMNSEICSSVYLVAIEILKGGLGII